MGGQSVVDELADPDIVVSYSQFAEPVRGAEQFKEILTQTFASFPDTRIEAEEPIAEGDRVALCWVYHATHRHGELFGVQPAGTPVLVSGLTVYRIVGGKVVEESGVVDNLSLLLQLGAFPGQGGA